MLAFPDQDLSLDDLERFATTIGPFGIDPYFGSVPGHPHVAQVRRDADETTTIFAETWHSDWSFLPRPPQATVLYGNVIPPVGGDTLFANQDAAWDALSPQLKTLLKDQQGIHSARRGYARDGMYGERDQGRSMAIRYDDTALATQLHPIARVHPETGRTALFVSPGYTIGIDGMAEAEAQPCCSSCSSTRCATNSSTATAGRRACWCCGTTAASCTPPPAATTATRGCCTASRWPNAADGEHAPAAQTTVSSAPCALVVAADGGAPTWPIASRMCAISASSG